MCVPTQGDSIRPLDVRRHQNLSVHSIHTRFLNLGRLAPVRPVEKPTPHTHTRKCALSIVDIRFSSDIKTQAFHAPRQRIHSNGCRFFEASVEQNFLLGSVEVGNRNGFGAEIRPVQVLIDPVHGNSHRSLDVVYHFIVGANVPSFVQHSAARTEKTETMLEYQFKFPLLHFTQKCIQGKVFTTNLFIKSCKV